MKSSILKVCIYISFFIIVGCQLTTNSNDSAEINALKDIINEYYTLEKKEFWSKTYEFRTPAFRKSVPKAFYVAEMKKDNKGWRLIKFEILSVEKSDGETIVKIKFKEKYGGQIDLLSKKPKYIIIEHDTKWKKIDERWFCLDAGTRTHLDLNSEIVKE
jgi:hypothetical protein